MARVRHKELAFVHCASLSVSTARVHQKELAFVHCASLSVSTARVHQKELAFVRSVARVHQKELAFVHRASLDTLATLSVSNVAICLAYNLYTVSQKDKTPNSCR